MSYPRPNPGLKSWVLRLRPFMLYVPVVAAIIAWLAASRAVGLAAGVVLYVAGLLAWTLLEYALHRAMHIPPLVPGMAWIQAFHLDHHRAPEDLDHAVINLRGSIPLAFLFLGLADLALGRVSSALLFLAGLITGYLVYEFVHLAEHARVHWPVLRRLTRHHARHHYQDEHHSFGVTSPLWDWVFGSLPSAATSTQRRPSALSSA